MLELLIPKNYNAGDPGEMLPCELHVGVSYIARVQAKRNEDIPSVHVGHKTIVRTLPIRRCYLMNRVFPAPIVQPDGKISLGFPTYGNLVKYAVSLHDLPEDNRTELVSGRAVDFAQFTLDMYGIYDHCIAVVGKNN